MGRWFLVLLVSGLIFGGAGIALGRVSERDLGPRAPHEECAVVTMSSRSVADEGVAIEPVVIEPAPMEPGSEPAGLPPEAGAPRVRRIIVTSGVRRHEPVDDLDEVRVGSGPVYAFVEAANAGGATELGVTFEPALGHATTGHISLEVPAHTRRHRTWAYSRGVRTEGLWYAVVRDADGVEVARTSFDVIAAE